MMLSNMSTHLLNINIQNENKKTDVLPSVRCIIPLFRQTLNDYIFSLNTIQSYQFVRGNIRQRGSIRPVRHIYDTNHKFHQMIFSNRDNSFPSYFRKNRQTFSLCNSPIHL